MQNEDTGFVDKHGKQIYVGDTVQVTLSSSTKAIIEKRGKRYLLVFPHSYNVSGQQKLQEGFCKQYVVVVERAY